MRIICFLKFGKMSQNLLSAAVVIGALRVKCGFNSFQDSSNFCSLLITFASSLGLDQDLQKVGPDLEQKLFDALMVFLKEIFGNIDSENIRK